MRRILAPLIVCSLLAHGGPAAAQRALKEPQPRPFRVLKQQVRAELSDAEWRALETAPMRRFALRSRWIGEDQEGFVSKDKLRTRVEYLRTPAERARWRLTIRDGLLFDAEGRPFGTGRGESHLVMDVDGELYGRELPDRATAKAWAHSSYTAGGPLGMSVEVRAFRGRVYQLKNRSGHYRPYRLAYFSWLLAMERRGLDLSEATIEFDKKSVLDEPGQEPE